METLKRIRTMRGLNQVDLAKASGVSQNTISEIETGRREARPATLRKLANALDIEIADFFEEADRPKTPAPPSSEPTLWNGLAEERRLRYLEPWPAYINYLADNIEADLATGELTLDLGLIRFDEVVALAKLVHQCFTPVASEPLMEGEKQQLHAVARATAKLLEAAKKLQEFLDPLISEQEREARRAELKRAFTLIQGEGDVA